jgi:hypothetical protein
MAANEPLVADARPTKRFFIQNLTRDLTLEDAVLDLVDNSVDSLIRTRGLEASAGLLEAPPSDDLQTRIAIHFTADEFRVDDTCGGMDLEHARLNVFRFGRTIGSYESSLGVYGIGLKRALFKIGADLSVTSRTTESGFQMSVNVSDWANKDDEWTFPLESATKAKDLDEAGTAIQIKSLNAEVKMRLGDGAFLKRLGDTIATTYALFLQRYLRISLNGVVITPRPLPLAETKVLPSNSRSWEVDGVHVSLVAGLQQRRNEEWSAESAGWYVLCNGRVIVTADRTELTGWGIGGPSFVSKHRGFLGIAFFFSDDPSKLPWTTTKRGINRESGVYQMARKEMSVLARPVLSFLNSFYPSDPAEMAPARDLVAGLEAVDVGLVVARDEQEFPAALPRRRGRRSTIKIQFDAERADVDRVRARLGKPGLAAGAVGRHTFVHFLQTECPE